MISWFNRLTMDNYGLWLWILVIHGWLQFGKNFVDTQINCSFIENAVVGPCAHVYIPDTHLCLSICQALFTLYIYIYIFNIYIYNSHIWYIVYTSSANPWGIARAHVQRVLFPLSDVVTSTTLAPSFRARTAAGRAQVPRYRGHGHLLCWHSWPWVDGLVGWW